MFFYLTNKKKWINQQSEDIIGYEHKEWTDPIQRFKNISDFVIDIIFQTYNPQIFIEAIHLVLKARLFFKSLKIVAYSNTDYKKKITLIKPLYQVLLKKVLQQKR